MFTALLKKITAEPVQNLELIQANEALKDRVAHMFWNSHRTPNQPAKEPKPQQLVKNYISIRKSIAA